MSYHNIPASARQSATNAQGQTAPDGYHYMPDGTLMADAAHIALYGSGEVIKAFDLDTTNIKPIGETRRFTITGDGVFSLEIKNEDNYYYNFVTNKFQAARARLDNISISGNYSNNIKFPAVSDADQYDFYLFADKGTKHAKYNEVRFDDNNIDINSSTGSDSILVQKVIYQMLDASLVLSTLSPNSLAVFTGQTPTNQTITTQVGKSVGKIPFSIPVSAYTTHSFRINRTPTIKDVIIWTTRNIGAAIAIEGEDVSGSTYYRWSIDNVDGLSAGMVPLGTNITSGSAISSYEEILTEMEGTEKEKKIVQKRVEALDKLGAKPTRTRNATTKVLTTVQTGNIVFNKKQVAALANDEIKIYAHGPSAIRALSGWDIELSDIAVTLTKPTAVTTAAVINSTSVLIDDGDGIMDDVSTVSSINMDSSVANPTVTNIGSYSGATATLTLSAAQTLESGETLTFDGAGRTVTISGNIIIKKVDQIRSDWNGYLYFDLEKFITATDES